VAGEIFAMSGATVRHNVIADSLLFAFLAHLRGSPCAAFSSSMKVRLKINRDDIFYYPDVMVACGAQNMDSHYVENPKLIVEVLSPSTEKIDRREKALNYRQIASLEEYVLVAQRTCEVTLYRRSKDWKPIVLTELEAVAEFSSIELSLPVAQIYERVL
jgi:Uma2 family endonuclease